MYLVKRKSDGMELAVKTFDKRQLSSVDKAKVTSPLAKGGINVHDRHR